MGDGSSTSRTLPVAVQGLTDAVAISSHQYHALAIRAGATVVAWGNNPYGELGDGTTTGRTAPVAVSNLTSVVAVAAGEYNSTALKADGTVWGWGYNAYGAVGDGSTSNRSTPVSVSGLTDVVAIAAGYQHRLALKSDGTVWAWGANDVGQLGDGTNTRQLTPKVVSTLSGVVRIAAGAWQSFAVTDDGRLWAWGNNNYGQLGDGTTTNRWRPLVIAGPVGVISLSTHYGHTVAVTADGTAWSWGTNSSGRLGDGTTADHLFPTPISGPGMLWRVITPRLSLASGTFLDTQSVTVTSADAGAVLHYTLSGIDPAVTDPVITSGGTIAITRSQTLKVSGWKPGTLTSVVAAAIYELKARTPTVSPGSSVSGTPLAATFTSATPESVVRYTVDGSEPVSTSPLYSGSVLLDHTLTLKARAFRDGWTGSDTSVSSYSITAGTLDAPAITPAPGSVTGPVFVRIDSGRTDVTIRYTLDGIDPTLNSPVFRRAFMVAAGTTVKAKAFLPGWGSSAVAVATYANGDAQTSALPLLVPAGGRFATRRTVTVMAPVDAVLRYTTTGMDPTDTDPLVPASREIVVDRALPLKVRAWQPGLTPSAVQRANFVITGAVAAGAYHVLALRADGTVWAWGSNQLGQLGDGTSGNLRSSPVQVLSLTDVVAVSGGGMFSLALKADGTVWAWGDNVAGQLGNGTNTSSFTPTRVSGLTNVIAIAAGDDHALAVTSDGAVWGWGHNGSGQLGDGTTVTRSQPVQVLGLRGVTQVQAGDDFSMALQTDGGSEGAVWAWGANASGQVGDGSTSARNVPVRLPGLPATRAIAAGRTSGLALSTAGDAWAWGSNAQYQMATTGGDRTLAAPVFPFGSLVSLGAGGWTATAIATNGVAWGWGYDGDGQIGTMQPTCSVVGCALPQRIGWTAIESTSGWVSSVALGVDGRVWSVGGNAAGQLGIGTITPSEVPVVVTSLRLVDNSWLASDADNDGLSTWAEYLLGTDPLNPDTNGNGIPDGIEAARGSAANLDSDNDGIPDLLEVQQGTDPLVADTDGDGVPDALDAFPLDPTRTTRPAADPNDVTPPTIVLTHPTNARRIR